MATTAGGSCALDSRFAEVRIVGRDHESGWLSELFTRAAAQGSVVTIDGVAGAGKSAVLALAAQMAEQSGMRVLRCQPSAAEAQYAYAALGDLLRDVADFEGVEPIPRRALERALLRAEPDGAQPVDGRAVGMACAALWRVLSAESPLLLLIDDVHWLDTASAEAIGFSARRLPDAGVVVLGARRTGEAGPHLPGESRPLEPLEPAAMMTLLADQAFSTDRYLTRRELRSIVDAADGNPLFAIELARHAARSAPSATSRPAVPPSIEALIAARFDHLSLDVVDALAVVAMLTRPTVDAVRRLSLTTQIEAAEREGLVSTHSGRAVFAHPLFAAAVLQRVPATTRRRLHRLIAERATDPEERWWHAAQAAEAPDAELAARVSAHAAALAARGAGDQAAEWASLAANLSPADDPALHERHVDAARLAFQRGEADHASELLRRLDGVDATPAGKVRELIVRSTVQFSLGGADLARRYALEALAHCTTDLERVEVHSILARVSYDNFDESTRQATLALELAQRCEVPPHVLASVLVARATEAFMAGHGLDRAMFEQAIELERDTVQFSANSAFSSLAVLLKIADEFDQSRTMLLKVLRRNDDDGALPFVLSHLPQLELWTGNWDAAEEYAQQHLDAALRTGQHEQVLQARNNLAQIDIHRGDVVEATVIAEGIRSAGREEGDAWTERNGLGLLGLVAMAEGDAERAVQHLQRWHDLAEQMALRDPGYRRMEGDLVEAQVATGRLDAAAEGAAAMQEVADRLGRPTLRAGAARARALVAAASGLHRDAVALARAAVDGYAATPMVVEHARSLLTLGQIHRRFKEKAPARAALEQALEVFDRLGAERLAERTRQDLARLGLRTTSTTALTATELRVARLAATGRTVRQVGDELFISPKTVEANLTRVYRKLGLSGRAELAHWAATVDTRRD